MAFGRVGSLGTGFSRLGAGRHVGGAAVGGAAMLVGETDGFAADFTYATDALRVAVKTAGTVVSQGLDTFFQNGGTSAKMIYDVNGVLAWTAHNLFLNSEVPATQTVTLVRNQNYTVTVTGSGSITGSGGAAGVATAGSPLTFTASATSCTFTLAGSLTRIQLNAGAVATVYLLTTAAARFGLAIDYNPVTHAARGLLCEPSATNVIVNTGGTTLATQTITVSAVAYMLSFWGTGTVTLSGVSTAGPLVGTGVANRVSLAFTPTAGSLTLTVTGTVTNAQLETGTVVTSYIPTPFGALARNGDNYTFLLSTIPALGSEFSLYCRFSAPVITVNRYAVVLTEGTGNELAGISVNTTVNGAVVDGGSPVGAMTGPTLVANAMTSAAMRLKLNDCALSVGGGAAVADTSVTMPTPTQVRFGNVGSGVAASANFLIEKVCIITARGWSNSELASKSAT